ncbi:MAG: fibronectin type III domain-containing protein [Patescibacteria group bacterium]|jgi:hypothetical protein
MKKILLIALILTITTWLAPGFLASAQVNNLPRIISLRISPGDKSATIYWSTNVPTTGLIKFGLTNGFGNWLGDNNLNTYHETKLSNLLSEKKYYFVLEAATFGNYKITSDIYNFTTTKANDKEAPSVTDVHTSFVTGNTATFVWKSDEAGNSCVHWNTNPNNLKNKECKNGLVKTHDITISKLKRNTLYYYQVSSKDKAGNEQYSVNFNFQTNTEDDKKVPELIIYEISPFNQNTGTSTSEIIITLKTNRPVEGEVKYGEKSKSYSKSKNLSSPRSTENSITLSNLKTNKTYYYKVELKDVLNKTLTTPEFTFTTLPQELIGPYQPSDPAQDFDHDGLTNTQETTYGTDAVKADTDGDGYIDGVEVAHGYNPLGLGRLGETKPTAGVAGTFAYGQARLKNLSEERRLAEELKNKLDQYFNSQIPKSTQHWYILVNSYIYGGYPVEAIAKAIKFSGKTVHPAIPWSAWQNNDDYKNYITK